VFFPKPSPFMLEFHSFYPFLSLYSSHSSPQNASDFTGFCVTCWLLHFSTLLLRWLLLSAHSHLFHNPCFSSPCLFSWTSLEYISLVYKREAQPCYAQIQQRPQRGQALGEIGMWGFDGDAHNAAGCVSVELCRA